MFSRRTIALHGELPRPMLFRIAPDPIHLHRRRSSIFPDDRNSAKIASAFSQGAKDRPPTKIHTVIRVNPLADFIVLSRMQCRIIHLRRVAIRARWHFSIISETCVTDQHDVYSWQVSQFWREYCYWRALLTCVMRDRCKSHWPLALGRVEKLQSWQERIHALKHTPKTFLMKKPR